MLCRRIAQNLPKPYETAFRLRAAVKARFDLQRRSVSTSSSNPGRGSAAQDRARTAGWAFAGAALGVSAVLSFGLLNSRRPIELEALPPSVHLPNIAHLDAGVLDDASKPMRNRMETFVKLLQHRIVTVLGKEENAAKFYIDTWQRKEGGEGISCVLQDGETFEKAGVNISIVHGTLPPRAIAQMSADHHGLVYKVGYKLGLKEGEEKEVAGLPFYASGLSLVVHPKNPFVPTVHFNYRYFELTHPKTLLDGSPNPKYDEANPTKPAAWWFGGGSDLTPIYLFNSDASHFHNTLKRAADGNDVNFYPNWKKWCDVYFWIPHRSEARGIGGIFFDDLTVEANNIGTGQVIPLFNGTKAAKDDEGKTTSNLPHTQETLFRTVQSMGNSFLPAYLPLVQSRKSMKYDASHVDWQAIRRGRYVEFNLVYDRGTKFGLQTPGARIESILMSLPLRASWQYSHKYSGTGMLSNAVGGLASEEEDGSGAGEIETMKVLRNPKEWATV
ncbi:hypothetical protein CBS101457_000339 [Exobasidium rhododendri]|nr:hypothetical protein CBS101457_000339 [Exobasidium rhododendri]